MRVKGFLFIALHDPSPPPPARHHLGKDSAVFSFTPLELSETGAFMERDLRLRDPVGEKGSKGILFLTSDDDLTRCSTCGK
ncbi:hypothetical protein NL676_036821 [Syzygium grande]|nr:hypothetical protein NL676_036821 [Syzygium grande]